MVIKHVKIRSFMGYKGIVEFDMPKIAALVGPNGLGKTSVLNAIRYALAGEEPDGDIINHESDECFVELTLTDPADGSDIKFSRSKHRSKPSKFKIDGVATTAAKLNEKIQDVCGIPIDKIKVLSSAEVVASMKPQEFSKFILDYIPEKIDMPFIIGALDKTNPMILDTIDANLPPEDIEIDDVDNFLDMLKSSRKDVKARLSEKKALYETKPKELAAPKSEVEEKVRMLKELLNKKEVLEAQMKAYNTALENAKRHDELLSRLKGEAQAITAGRPDPVVRDNLLSDIERCNKLLNNKKVEIAGVKSAVAQLQITLDALNKPICPISPLITCHTDKSVAKEDISSSIESSNAGLVAMEEDEKILTAQLKEAEGKLSVYDAGKAEYMKKVELSKRIKELEDNAPVVPAKPEAEISDVEGAKEALRDAESFLRLNAEYEEGLKLLGNIEALSQELETLEYLIKAFGDKGCVRVAILAKYTKVFEDLINERSQKIRKDIEFKIVPENGMTILMDTGNGFLPYSNLSGGEQSYMLFMIMDMLNSLSGTRILFIDELSVMDADNFNSLLDIICEYQGEYDHIIFAAVNHEETVESVSAHAIPMVKLAPLSKEEELIA